MDFNRKVHMVFVFIFLLVNGCVQGYSPDFPSAARQLNQISSEVWAKLDRIPEAEYRLAANLGHRSANQDANLEANLRSKGVFAGKSSEAYVQFLETKPNERSQSMEEFARRVMKANRYFVNKYCLPENIDPHMCAQYLLTKSLPANTDILQKCEQINDRNLYAYTRLLPPRYKDGVHAMLKAPILPLPRRVARSADEPTEADQSHVEHNLLVMQWAQFIGHDLSKPISTTMHNGDPIKCCTPDQRMLPPRDQHPACAPLEGADMRDEYSYVSCHNYVRNAPTINSNCTFGPAVMLNQENGKLDLSPLYGLSTRAQSEMRTFQDGLLKSSNNVSPKTALLPYAEDPTKFCAGTNPTNCYMAGDSRVNSNPFVTHLYTIFLRSHNIIALNLKKQNPNHSDETLYRMARNKNIEEYVQIIYNWWLPTVIGESPARSVINPRSVNLQKSVSSEFGVAAIRFYLSMMPDSIELSRHCNTSNLASLDLSEHMYNSDYLNQDCKMNALLDAMLSSSPHKADFYYKHIVLKNCLKSRNSNMGINCLALDIQRGRDHGLAGYTKYLEVCANTKILNWESLKPFIDTKELNALRSQYGSIDKIDLIVGAMAEKQTNGLLGVTFSCIIADEFSKIWNQTPFNLNEKRPVAAQLLCRTTGIKAVPQNLFQVESERNPLIVC